MLRVVDNQFLNRHFQGSDMARCQSGTDQQLLAMAGHLPDFERSLVELLLSNRVPRYRIARMLGVPTGTITRRLRRIAKKLYNPLTSALLDPRCSLPADSRELAIEYLLQDRPLTDLARQHGVTRLEVRNTIEYVRGWHRGLMTGRQQGRA